MKTAILALVFGFHGLAFAATPVQSVTNTVQRLVKILSIPDNGTRARQMCQLVRSDLDVRTIGAELLGRQFSTLAQDQKGVAAFMALVPSIIVSEFFDKLDVSSNPRYTVSPVTIPRGSQRVGVPASVNDKSLLVVVSTGNSKIVDVEYQKASLVQNRAREYQRDLRQYWSEGREASTPVSKLAQKLSSSGRLIRCN